MNDPDCTVFRAGRGMIYAAAGLCPARLAQVLADPAELLLRHLDRPAKLAHPSVMVEAELPLTERPVRVAYKQFRPREWWKGLRRLFRPARAAHGWRQARALRARGVATPRPLIAWVPCGWRRLGPSYLVTEWIAGAENLHLYGWRLAARPPGERLPAAARCAESLGMLIGRMHAAGISHRDLKAANLLVVPGDEFVTYVADVDGTRTGRRVSVRRRAADLARLAAALAAHPWVTRAIGCRFLRAYAAQFPPGEVAWKLFWRQVAARQRQLVGRKRRRGQEVL